MLITLCIMYPFSEEKKQVEWVHVECPGGNFVVGPGHRPLVNILSGNRKVLYKEGGQQQTIDVSATGGLIHVTAQQVILFLN